MIHTKRTWIVGFTCLLLSSLAWAQNGLLRGTVVDSDGSPLSGAKVTITSEELTSFRKTLTTDGDGEFKIRFQNSQSQYLFNLLFEKSGFQSFTQPYSPSVTRQTREEFVMEASQSQVIESHGDLGAVVTGSTNVAIEAFNAGLTAQQDGDLTTARSKLEEALSSDPSLVPANMVLSQVLLDSGESESAIAAANQTLALAPGNVEALRVKHQALLVLGRNDDAELVSAALDQAEDAVASARRLYNEGATAFQAKDQITALTKFRRAAELDPSLHDAHHAVATLEYANGDYAEAAAAAEKALELGSEDVRTLRVLYDAYDALGRTEDLTEIAPRLAEIDPDFGGVKLVEQAGDLWNSGQPEQAARLSRLALSLDPNLGKAYYFVGLDHVSRRENVEAKAALEKFLTLAPEDAEAQTARDMLSYLE